MSFLSAFKLDWGKRTIASVPRTSYSCRDGAFGDFVRPPQTKAQTKLKAESIQHHVSSDYYNYAWPIWMAKYKDEITVTAETDRKSVV